MPYHPTAIELLSVRHSHREKGKEPVRSVLWLHGCEPCARSERAFPSIPQQEKERRKNVEETKDILIQGYNNILAIFVKTGVS